MSQFCSYTGFFDPSMRSYARSDANSRPLSETNRSFVPSGEKSAGELFTVPVCFVMFVAAFFWRSCRKMSWSDVV